MAGSSGWHAGQLRHELRARNRIWARGRLHAESCGSAPVTVYAPENGRHGNFLDDSYSAIARRPEWMRRFDKIHAQGRALPRLRSDPARKWRELDSCMSSDALLMNIFCAPGVAESGTIRRFLGTEEGAQPIFGWKARVPLTGGRLDRTEVDMRWGSLLVEAKLTEDGFQTREARIVESYRDFDAVFDRDRLPRVQMRAARRRAAIEFAEDFTQEWEPAGADANQAAREEVARAFQSEVVARAREAEASEAGYAGYQLIRNVLAAHAEGCSFCVMYDERRPDLREAWFAVMAAVKPAEMRVRCKALTWQELTELLPQPVQDFLFAKYGIAAPGTVSCGTDIELEDG